MYLIKVSIFIILRIVATPGIEPDLTAHEAIVQTFTPYR